MKILLEVFKKYYKYVYPILLCVNIFILSYHYPIIFTKNRMFNVLTSDVKTIYTQLLKLLFNIFVYLGWWFGLDSLFFENLKDNIKNIIHPTIQIFIFIGLLVMWFKVV